MYFHSIPYFCFLPLVVFFASKIPISDRWKFITFASLIFYAWHSPTSLLFLALVATVSYVIGRKLEEETARPKRVFLIWSAVTIFVLTIASAKYLPDLVRGSATVDFVVPLGLSFYSFQALGYLIDVYRRTRHFEPNFGSHVAFICFFPTLLSGPIERAESLLPQLKNPSDAIAKDRERHLLLFYCGLFKKLVIADALAKFVTPIFQYPEYFKGFTLFLGIALARYMIFADFSGYADMAVASAGLLGIRIRQNFMRPFFATSLIDYWRRWHISLHDWMKDYVFYSLSVTSIGRALGIYFCLFVSFLFMGAWHEIGLTFLAVGVWHGTFICFDYMTRDYRARLASRIGLDRIPVLHRIIQAAVTFVFFIMPPTVFFLAKNINDAATVFRRVFEGEFMSSGFLMELSFGQDGSLKLLLRTLAAILIVEALHIVQANGGIRDRVLRLPAAARVVLYIALLVILILYGQTFGERPYVYFQF